MGAAAETLGDTLTCCRSYSNITSIAASQNMLHGRDLEDDLLTAVKLSIENSVVVLTNRVRLSVMCYNLPNMDTFTRTDGMAVLFK